MATVLALGVVVGPLVFVVLSITQQNSVSSRTVAARQAASLISRFGRELSAAQFVLASAGGGNATPVLITSTAAGGGNFTSTADFYVSIQQDNVTGPNGPTGATTTVMPGTHVVWTCTAGGSCVRAANGVQQIEFTGVVSAVFTPVTGPTGLVDLVQISLMVKDASQLGGPSGPTVRGVTNSIHFQNAVDLRNYP